MTGFRSPQESGGLTSLENRSWYVREKLSHAVAGDQRASAHVCIPKVCKVRCLPCSATTSTLELRSGKERAHRQTLRPVISRSACPARSSASAAPRSRRATSTSPARSYSSFSRSARLRRRLSCLPAPPYAPPARSTADHHSCFRRFESSHDSLT